MVRRDEQFFFFPKIVRYKARLEKLSHFFVDAKNEATELEAFRHPKTPTPSEYRFFSLLSLLYFLYSRLLFHSPIGRIPISKALFASRSKQTRENVFFASFRNVSSPQPRRFIFKVSFRLSRTRVRALRCRRVVTQPSLMRVVKRALINAFIFHFLQFSTPQNVIEHFSIRFRRFRNFSVGIRWSQIKMPASRG